MQAADQTGHFLQCAAELPSVDTTPRNSTSSSKLLRPLNPMPLLTCTNATRCWLPNSFPTQAPLDFAEGEMISMDQRKVFLKAAKLTHLELATSDWCSDQHGDLKTWS